jgi:uncharacterized protein YndB with AHSA1/START domain
MVATPRLERSVEMELFLRATPQRVFDAFATPEVLKSWMRLAEAQIDPRPGGYWRYQWRGGDVADGTVVAYEPPHRLVTDWHEAPNLHDTRLTIEITAEDAGTRLRLINSGFGYGGEWDTLFAGVEEGWSSGLAQLRVWLEEGRSPE